MYTCGGVYWNSLLKYFWKCCLYVAESTKYFFSNIFWQCCLCIYVVESTKYFVKIFLESVVYVYMWWSLLKCGTWHGLARGKLISGFTQHKKSRFKGTRLRRAHTNSTFIDESFEVQYNSLCMGVESPKQIFGVVGNLRSPALAGRAGRAQGLELNIQICPKPPTH